MADKQIQVEVSGDSSGLLASLSKGLEGLKGFAEGVKTHMEKAAEGSGRFKGEIGQLEGKVKSLREELIRLKQVELAGGGDKATAAQIRATSAALANAEKDLRTFTTHAAAGTEQSKAMADAISSVGTVSPGAGAALSSLAGGPVTAIAAGAVALIGALAAVARIADKAITKSAEFADSMGKESQKAGITTQAYSALAYAAEQADVPREALTKGFEKLGKTMVAAAENTKSDAAHAFDTLGISVRGANGDLKASDVVFEEVAEKLSGMEDGAKKTALAQKVFGKAGAELIPMLNEGKEGLDAFKKKAEELGVVVGDKDAQAAAEMNDALKDLKTVGEGLWIQLGKDAIPIVADLLHFILDLAKEALPGASVAGGGLRGVLIELSLWFKNNVTDTKAVIDILAVLWATYDGIEQAVLRGDFAGAKAIAQSSVAAVKGLEIARELQHTVNETAAEQQRLNIALEGPKKKRTGGGQVDDNTKADKEKEQDKEFEQLKAKLEAEREFYENSNAAKGQYVEWQKTQDAAFWKGVLERDDLSEKTRAKAQQEYFKARREELKKAHEEELKLNEEYAKRDKAEQIAALDAQQAEVNHAQQLGIISETQALQETAAIEARKFEIEKATLEARLAVASLEPSARAKLYGEVEALEASHAAKMRQISFQLEAQTHKANEAFLSALGNSQSSWNTLWLAMETDAKNATAHIGTFFKSLATIALNALNSMITKTLLYKGVKLLADKQIISSETAKRAATLLGITTDQAATASTTTKAAADSAAVAPNVANAASTTFQTHAAIPFVGAIIAAGLVLYMLSTMSKVTGRQVGGLVGQNGPELTMLGERGLEVVAPESDFKDWAGALVGMGANLGANIAYRQAQVTGLDRTAAGYAHAPVRQASGGPGQGNGENHLHLYLAGATFVDGSRRGKQEFANHVMGSLIHMAKSRGVVLKPGQIFGGI